MQNCSELESQILVMDETHWEGVHLVPEKSVTLFAEKVCEKISSAMLY